MYTRHVFIVVLKGSINMSRRKTREEKRKRYGIKELPVEKIKKRERQKKESCAKEAEKAKDEQIQDNLRS